MVATLDPLVPTPIDPCTPTAASRILVVDDTEANRDLLVRRLRHPAYRVSTASDGREALELLRREPFDVMLLDIMMPGLDGYHVLEELRRDPALAAVRVIMISAVDELESVARCLALGADDYLPKPCNATLLRARLESSIARKKLRDREWHHTRGLERELEIGREIQGQFLPPTLPHTDGWEIAALLEPARQVSGDFYDVFELDDGSLVLIVADVCDKGVGAALFMALYRTLLRASAAELNLPAARLVRTCLRRTNDYVAGVHSASSMFATVFFAVLDPTNGALAYTNAGHEPAWIRRRDGSIERLEANGPAVGLWPGLEFGVTHVTLEPGDTLVASTDGVSEARNQVGAFYLEQGLCAAISAAPAAAEGMLAAIAADVARHRHGAPQSDDITLLVLQRNETNGDGEPTEQFLGRGDGS
jgi:CheY-like chemotaxis protein